MPALPRLRSDESGFTLIELLMSLALGSLVLTAVMTVFIRGIEASTAVQNRTESAQRGRLAMDRITTLLNSQTCLYTNNGGPNPPIVDGQDISVTFYANLGDVSADPSRYRLTYDATKKQIVEEQWAPSRDVKGNVQYVGVPTSKLLLASVIPEAAGTPVFRYFQFVTAVGATQGTIDPVPLPTVLTPTTRFAAVRVEAAFSAQPERSKLATDPRSTVIRGAGTVGSAEASDPLKGVNC
jgi:prepilin-type N-terminal cleavage/methylation domain-containing protein